MNAFEYTLLLIEWFGVAATRDILMRQQDADCLFVLEALAAMDDK